MEYQYGKDGKVVRERKQGRIRKEGVEGKRTTLLSLHKVHSKGGTGKHFILGIEFVFYILWINPRVLICVHGIDFINLQLR